MKAVVHRILAVLAIGAAALAAFARTPEPPLAQDEISAVELAEWIRARRPGLLVIDTRPAEATLRDGIPGARSAAQIDDEDIDTLVFYGDRNLAPQAGPHRVLKLRGGIEAWNRDVLFPTLRSDASEARQREFAARAQLSRYFGGSPRVLDPGADAGRPRSRRGC